MSNSSRAARKNSQTEGGPGLGGGDIPAVGDVIGAAIVATGWGF